MSGLDIKTRYTDTEVERAIQEAQVEEERRLLELKARFPHVAQHRYVPDPRRRTIPLK